MLRLGLIGFGAIGRHVAAALTDGRIADVTLIAALVRRARSELQPIPLDSDPERFFARGYDTIVEGAGHEAVRAHGVRCLESGADLMVTSVGAFTDQALFDRMVAAARHNRRRLILPSAGIGALDMLCSAAVGGLESVLVTVRKDPTAWKGTAAETLINLDAVRTPTTIFDGPVREGARLYPQNVNISAAAALAGIGLDRTRVQIVADPTISRHVVELQAEGTFGRFSFREEVEISDENPKTGKIVAMAVIRTIRQLTSPVVMAA